MPVSSFAKKKREEMPPIPPSPKKDMAEPLDYKSIRHRGLNEDRDIRKKNRPIMGMK